MVEKGTQCSRVKNSKKRINIKIGFQDISFQTGGIPSHIYPFCSLELAALLFKKAYDIPVHHRKPLQ